MAQLIGTALLIIGTSGIALMYCNEQKERLRILKQMREIFIRIQKEMGYLKAAMPEICLKLSENENAFSKVFLNIYEEMELNNGCSFNDIWQRLFEERLKKTPLKEAEKEMIKRFPESLIYRDSGGQAEGVKKYIDDTSAKIDLIEAEIKNKNKVVMSLGIMAGIVTVVIFI